MKNPPNRKNRCVGRTSGFVTSWLALLMATGMIAGCRDEYPLSGRVMVNGEVIQNGTIMFRPDEEAGNSGPSATTRIVDGRFLLPAGQKFTRGPTIAEITDKDRPGVKLIARFNFPDTPTDDFEIQAQPAD